MGITPQELKEILTKTNPPEPSGGFVTSTFLKGDRRPKKFTSRQYRAMWNGSRVK